MQMQIFSICFQVLEQWGYLQKQAEKWIYPIPVLEAFIATKTCISNNHSAAGYVGYWTWDKDITTEYAYSWNNYPSYCFMIGKVQQQWGENVGGGGQTVSLPISFEVAFTAVVSADSSWCNASCHITTTTITTMNYQSNKPDIAQLGPVQWLAIGIQPQWGNMNSGNTDVSFNIPYTNYVIGVNFSLISNRAEAAHEREVWPMGVTLNGFKQMASASGADTNKLNWFSIGF